MDLDELIDGLRNEGKQLSIKDLRILCEKLKEIFIKESNLQIVQAPVTICGNVNGQLSNLLELFRTAGEIPLNNYVFLGGYVSNGRDTVQIIELLLCLKLKYPGNITLIRGRHETRSLSRVYGFRHEVKEKYGSIDAWKIFTDLFDYLPMGALVEGKVFCVNAGLSPEIKTLDEIELIDRRKEIPDDGPCCDLVWSERDPGGKGWKAIDKGIGYAFGEDVVKEFNFVNNLELIACGRYSLSGYDFPYGTDSLVKIFSTPNYKSVNGNLGAVMKLDENLDKEFICLVSKKYLKGSVFFNKK